MGEGFWPAGAIQLRLGQNEIYAQTFSPRWSHTLAYIRYCVWYEFGGSAVKASLQYLKPDGTPTGMDIFSFERSYYSTSVLTLGKMEQPSTPPLRLVKDINYALLLEMLSAPLAGGPGTRYIPVPGGYPRGKLIKSTDHGLSWNTTDLGDMLFEEWGDPPIPPSSIPPPIYNMAVMDLCYTHWDLGLTICLPTNVPCHLTCYYTDKKPLKHDLSRVVRGITVPWSTYFCFVAWQTVEQTEIGDTLYHTFEFPDWQPCQTKWLAFRGEVDLQVSPSVGPIFEHHHPGGQPHTITLRPNAPGDLTQIPYVVPSGMPHWQAVSDIIPDEDATVVTMYGSPAGQTAKDLYHIQPSPITGAIASIEICERTRAQYPYYRPTYCRSCIKTHGTIYYGGFFWNYLFYQTHSKVYAKNPFTNEQWTPDEVTNLQIGVELQSTYIWYTRCTQLYAIIHRGIECRPY